MTPLVRLFGVLVCGSTLAADNGDVVFGPKNANLQDGASELRIGNAEEGVRLTRAGLRTAISTRDRRIALSNLCAGYIMLGNLDEALSFCNKALDLTPDNWRIFNNRALIYVLQKQFDLAQSDIENAERLNPQAKSTRHVRRLLNDGLNPVVPEVEIDDREGIDSNASKNQ